MRSDRASLAPCAAFLKGGVSADVARATKSTSSGFKVTPVGIARSNHILEFLPDAGRPRLPATAVARDQTGGEAMCPRALESSGQLFVDDAAHAAIGGCCQPGFATGERCAGGKSQAGNHQGGPRGGNAAAITRHRQIHERSVAADRLGQELVIALALSHLAAEHPIAEMPCSRESSAAAGNADQHEELRGGIRRGLPHRERRRHEIGNVRDRPAPCTRAGKQSTADRTAGRSCRAGCLGRMTMRARSVSSGTGER